MIIYLGVYVIDTKTKVNPSPSKPIEMKI